jgi:Subtilase family
MRALTTNFLGSLACVMAITLGAGCGDDQPEARLPQRNVMVIDDGFDPSLPVVQGKVAGAYTIECATEEPDAQPGGGNEADMKAALLAELAVADDSCRLRPGIDPVPSVYELPQERGAWNAAVRDDVLFGNPFRSSSFDWLYAELARQLDTTSFHGTATSGVIATDNPSVNLVLVQVQLGTAEIFEEEFECFVQADIDETVSLLSDPDVKAAYARRPQATVDAELAAARATHDVGIVNQSFSQPARHVLEELQWRARCKDVSFGPFYRAWSEVEQASRDAYPEPGVLVVQSAGNGASLINGPEDSIVCRPGDSHHVLVGSYGRQGARSFFTNFGECVDVYAPGEDVIGPLPGDWLFPLSGTSFAAPLVARLLSLTTALPFDPTSAHEDLIVKREPNRNLIARHFPSALLYDPGATKAYMSALTSPTGAPPAVAGGADRISRAALHRLLWPLRWTARHRSS